MQIFIYIYICTECIYIYILYIIYIYYIYYIYINVYDSSVNSIYSLHPNPSLKQATMFFPHVDLGVSYFCLPKKGPEYVK